MKIVFLLLVAASSAFGATSYYVDATAGEDAASGLSGTPWKTLLHVQGQTFAAGDTIFLKRGETWPESLTNSTTGITFDAYGTGSRPIVDGGGVRRHGMYMGQASSNTTTRNLHIKSGGGGTGSLWSSLVGTNTIEDCLLDGHAVDACVSATGLSYMIARRCIIRGAYDDGVTLHSSARGLVENCTITNCTQGVNNSGTDMQLTINDSIFADNLVSDLGPMSVCPAVINRCTFRGPLLGSTIKFCEGSDTSISFNYCSFDASRAGVNFYASFTPLLGLVNLNNCDFYGGGYGTFTVAAAGTITMTNCIVKDWWRLASITSGGVLTLDHCIVNGVTVTNWTSVSSLSTSDPLFVSPGTGNFQLQAGSPGVNAGIAIGLPSDLAGLTVSNPPEIGAYERPPAITNLTRSARRRL